MGDDQWKIAGFKMEASSRFDNRRKGFAKLGGAGYDWDIDEDLNHDAVCDLGCRIVKE